MVCNAFKEIFGNNFYFVTSPLFTWDNTGKMPIDEDTCEKLSSPSPYYNSLQSYPTPPVMPTNNYIKASADNYYFIDDDHTIETFMKEYEGCTIVIYLNNSGSIYQGEDKFICPTCGVEHPPRLQKHIRYYIDEASIRKLKLRKLS